MAKGISQVEFVVHSYSEIELLAATLVARTMKQLDAKKISKLVVDSLEAILQCMYEEARIGARSVIYNVVEQMLLDLWHLEVMGKTFYNHIGFDFATSDATDKIGEKLLSTKALMVAIAAFSQQVTGKELVVKKSSRRLNNS